MIIVTTETVPGYRIVKSVGVVRGNTVRARHLGQDIVAGLKQIVGGEVHEYAQLIAEAREQAIDRMIDHATREGANGIICVRFTTSVMMQGAAELFAFGTGVVVEPES